ncbi:hypothetical protein T492DRAFT_848687 [Pavlovales sp. CCMP2436]|nr:hypothetical protein T492DRAFT_848687 [Pavlovales sp. CCMP2436]
MLEIYTKNSFAPFHNKHAANPHLARWNENADIPRDDRDRGGYNIDTIRMINQHTATGFLLCPDTNNDAGLHYRATVNKMVIIHTDLDLFVEYCDTPHLVKLFISLKKEEYAEKKMRAVQNTTMSLRSTPTPPSRPIISTIGVPFDTEDHLRSYTRGEDGDLYIRESHVEFEDPRGNESLYGDEPSSEYSDED